MSIETAARCVRDTFQRDLDAGYVTKDKRFAVDVLSVALAALTPPADPKPAVPGNDAEMREAAVDQQLEVLARALCAAKAVGADPDSRLYGTDVRLWHRFIPRARKVMADLAALAPQTGSAGEDPKTPDAGVGPRAGKPPCGECKNGLLFCTRSKHCMDRYPFVDPAPVGEDETGVWEALKARMEVALDGQTRFSRDCSLSGAYLCSLVWPMVVAALAPQPPKADTPAGVGDTLREDLNRLFQRHTGKSGGSFTDDAWPMIKAALSAAPAARPGDGVERVRHVKRGTEYEVLGEAEAQVSVADPGHRRGVVRHIEDGKRLTVYRDPKSGKLWCRFTDEFRDGRFVPVAAPAADGGPVDTPETIRAKIARLSDRLLRSDPTGFVRLTREAEVTTLCVGPRITISCETDTQARAIYDALEQLLDVTSS